jgi:hypothetical protein
VQRIRENAGDGSVGRPGEHRFLRAGDDGAASDEPFVVDVGCNGDDAGEAGRAGGLVKDR